MVGISGAEDLGEMGLGAIGGGGDEGGGSEFDEGLVCWGSMEIVG
jgi:hypothetical protein